MDFHYDNQLAQTGEANWVKQTAHPWTKQTQDGQNYNFIDIDNDGDLDMALTNWGGASNRLYLNENGSYTALEAPFTTGGVCLANAWGDFDNDSYIDVIITAGGTGQHAGLYRNNGNNTFDFKGNIILDNIGGNSAGISLGDYDNDGDLDFFTVGMEKGLFRNDLPDHNAWLNVALTGVESNTAALGAKIRAKASIKGREVWQIREISAQNTFMGHNSLRAHFGLLDATVVDSLIISWPSGLEEIYTDVPVRTFQKYTEGDSNSTGIAFHQLLSPDLQVYPNPANDHLWIEWDSEEFGQEGQLHLLDITGKVIYHLTGMTGSKVSIPTDQFAAGLYVLRSTFRRTSSKTSVLIAR